MQKIKNLLFKFLYALPFGLKGADSEIMGSSSNGDNNGTEINQQVEDKTVAKHLLKGEVTQAVEELRYRTYKVDEESKNYEYLGNGVAVKKEEKEEIKNKTKFRFLQRNRLIVNGVLDELNRLDSYGKDSYALEIMYSSYPRFKVEEFADRIMVNADTKAEKYQTTLAFSLFPNQYNVASKPFIIELDKLRGLNLDSEYAVNHHSFLNTLSSISFSTYKADGEEDFTNYSFLGKSKPIKVEFTDQECFITYEWTEMIRLPFQKLSEKYSSQTMEDKYATHEEKHVDPILESASKVYHCEICGKEYTTSKNPGICDECYQKMLNK